MPEIPTLSPNQNRFLAVLSETGSLDLAMSCACLSKGEAASIPEAYITQARSQYDQTRIADAKRLVNRARDVALLSENPKDMSAVAEMLAPESFVYPQEKPRQKAKGEHSLPQVQINIATAELAERLQKELRAIPSNVLENSGGEEQS